MGGASEVQQAIQDVTPGFVGLLRDVWMFVKGAVPPWVLVIALLLGIMAWRGTWPRFGRGKD